MAKKGKRSNREAPHMTAAPPEADVGNARKRIRDFADVADSDDEFHISNDKVLLEEGPEAKRRKKWLEQEEFLQHSDEEVLGVSDEDDDDDDLDGQEEDRVEAESDMEGQADENTDDGDNHEWGASKEYAYGADVIETEEQALEEEAEALRLQKKQLQAMSTDDYGFDETQWQAQDPDETIVGKHGVVSETLPQLQIVDDMGAAERMKLLHAQYPEFEPLRLEFLRLKESFPLLEEEARPQDPETPLVNATARFQAAAAYLGALAMYFALLASPAVKEDPGFAMSQAQLRDHPIMETLFQCRELWSQVKDLPADELSNLNERLNGDILDTTVKPSPQLPAKHSAMKGVSRQQKSRGQRHADAAQAAAEARKAERVQAVEAELLNLDSLVAASSTKRKQRKSTRKEEEGSDPEETSLTVLDAAEKAQRKKGLRFYTSQIAQKANKRGAAGRSTGGDDDIPYRERLKDRQARLNAEAEKRGQKQVDHAADLGGESDDEDRRQARAIRNGPAEDEDYYDFVAARTEKKKGNKAALAEVQKAAAAQGGRVVEEAIIGSDGKRAITYAIEKNKGLTPHRRKDVRNPRVKKRKKFEEKKKKLGSIKPVYKGGEGRGGYGGELTGIKKGLVKSTKL